MSETGASRIRVNQRALVHKVLARYPEKFAVFREIIQNADDATAKEVEIEFQTSNYVPHRDTAGKMNGTTATAPTDLNTEVFKWVVRNNGTPFGDDDWDRVKKIGDGNPDAQKIGAFGVGFYSVFSVTDHPVVKSGGKSLSIFFGDDEDYARTGSTESTLEKNELYTLEDEYLCDDDHWTTIEMKLKQDIRRPIPNLFDFARFLSANLAFTSQKTISVLFDGQKILKIEKSIKNIRSLTSDVSRDKEEVMKVGCVSVATHDILVTIPAWALAAANKKPSAERHVKHNLNESRKHKEFWGSSKLSEDEEILPISRTSSSAEQIHTSTASYAVYSVKVTTNLSDELREGLKSMTKKDPLSCFELQMIYFSKEEHDARAKEDKNDRKMGSVFRGSQGLFPNFNGDSQSMSRIFIGQSTAQTTGIGGHLCGPFIPTVERGSIDLTNSHIATWNKELLHVGGFLARLVYETKIKKISGTLPMDGPTADPPSSKNDALYVMRYFPFRTSTPNDEVSKILRDAFFDCTTSNLLPILSSLGIRYTKDVRQPDPNFRSFMKRTPVLLPREPSDPPSLVDTLPKKYEVPEYKFNDVVEDLKGRILQTAEVTSLLRWWVDAYQEGLDTYGTLVGSNEPAEKNETEANEAMRKITVKLKQVVIWHTGDSKREVSLCDISKFVDSALWLPWLSQGDPLPPDTIPLAFTGILNKDKILKALDWQPMTIVDWLSHLKSDKIDPAHDICRNETYSNQVLDILGNIWRTLLPDDKSEATELMKEVSWIATGQGFQKASDAYFSKADIFGDLPVVTANVLSDRVEHVLIEFGVKSRLDFDEFFEKAARHDLSAEKMIKYIWSDQNFRGRLDEVKTQVVFPCENGKKYCATDLYFPRKDTRELRLPILKWDGVIDFDEDKMLTALGIRKHPPLEKIIEIAGSDNLGTRQAAFKYFSLKFDELYEKEYDPLEHEGAFIPVEDGADRVGAHKDVFDSDHPWTEIGFMKVACDGRMKSRLKILKAPSTKRLIEVIEEKAPQDHSTAAKWFAFFETIPGLTPDAIQQVAELPIVPIEDQHRVRSMVRPRDCFFNSDQYPNDHHYRRIFPFIDFGESGNKFLKHCGVKDKPDCSDIVKKLIEDPDDFFKKTLEGERGAEKYLAELRLIAGRLSEEHKKEMRDASIFVGYRVPLPPKLHPASNILIADDLENRQVFEKDAWLAPQDETLEKLYESMGSESLGNHIKYNVKPTGQNIESSEDKWPKDVRRNILEKLPIFLHGVDKQRLKNLLMHLYWEEESRFLVRSCEDLDVEKRLDFQYWMSPQQPGFKYVRPVSAEITTEENSPLILWHKKVDSANQVDMYDIAAALCRLLLKSHKKHDVFSLMAILETETETLKRQGYEVDRILEVHKVNVREAGEKLKEVQKSQPADPKSDGNGRFVFGFRAFKMWSVRGSAPTGSVEVSGTEKSIVDILEQLKQLSPETSEIRNKGHSDAGKKLKNVKYCAKQTDLEPVDAEGVPDHIKVWKHKTAQEEIPKDLTEFATIVNDLREVFGLKNDTKDIFNIFWYPKNSDLMGFNCNRLIYLNLARYITWKRERHKSEMDTEWEAGKARIEWYQIIVHEIAHHETPFHDERHELLASALSSRFLRSLHELEDVRQFCADPQGRYIAVSAQGSGSGDIGSISSE